MATWREQVNICDPWSYYDYKTSFSSQAAGRPSWEAPNWMPAYESRRQTAYHFLSDMCKNRGRLWMDIEVDQDDRQDHREYGDPAMIVSAIVSSVTGDVQEIRVDGVSEEGPDGGLRTDQQELMQEWMQQERFLIKLMSNEMRCAKLGDQCYVLGIDQKNLRPRIMCYDPGFYFPVLDDWSHNEDYPRKVHIAWEYEKKGGDGKMHQYLRRITWWMEEIEEQRSYLWNALPVNETCYMKELEWDMQNILSTEDIFDISEGNAIVIQEETDLFIDFIPVVHIPNLPAEDEHWGTSCLAFGMQTFDDLSATDSDLQSAASTTGSPPLGIEDVSLPTNEDGEITTYGPGQVFAGKLNLVDTSRALDALLKLKESLQERLEVNLRVPKTLIGRVDPGKVNAGIILTLSFQPHSNMIRMMRLVRKDKYDLLLKFVGRFYLQLNRLSVLYPMSLTFGSYLPADRQETNTIVWNGLSNHTMSIETAVALQVEAGYPIEDAILEVERIVQQNYDAAKTALDASGDLDFARSLLGLPPVTEDLGLALDGEPPPDLTATVPSNNNSAG